MSEIGDFSAIAARMNEEYLKNEAAFADHKLTTRNRDPEQQEHISDNPFRRQHRGVLADRDTAELCLGLNLFATELGIPFDLPVPPYGLPGALNRKFDMAVILLIRRASEYPFCMARGESRSLWNIHDEIKGALEKAYTEGWEAAHLERDKIEAAVAEERYAAQAAAPQVVYFIQCGDDGAIKIGIASDPVARLRSLQTAHHERLSILVTTEGGQRAEQAYHKRFAEHRLSGEWFNPHPDILAEISRLAALSLRGAA